MNWKVIAGALTTALIFTSQTVYATSIPVTSTLDEMDINGKCSLREAIEAANTDTAVDTCPAGADDDIIVLESETYNVTIPGEVDFDNSKGALTIGSSLTLSGTGKANTYIVGGPDLDDALIHAGSAGDPLNILIEGVTLQGGEEIASLWNATGSYLTLRSSAVMSGTGDHAGGIYNQGQLTLIDSVVEGNSTTTAPGGISNVSTMTVTNSVIDSNQSISNTGGIYSQGLVKVYSSTVSNNAGWQGGGMQVTNGTPNLIANSVISANRAISGAGGIFVFLGKLTISETTVISNHAVLAGGIGNAGDLLVESSKILSNTADRGAGIGNALKLEVRNSQIAYNKATGIGGGIGNDGGTNYSPFLIGQAVVFNTFIEHNEAARGGGIGQAGAFTLTNSILRGNIAGERGGGISIGNGSTTISDTEVTSNTAPAGAGLFFTFEEQYGSITSTLELQMTQLLGNDRANCAVEGGTATSLGNNVSSDASCVAILTDDSDENGDGGEVRMEIFLPDIKGRREE